MTDRLRVDIVDLHARVEEEARADVAGPDRYLLEFARLFASLGFACRYLHDRPRESPGADAGFETIALPPRTSTDAKAWTSHVSGVVEGAALIVVAPFDRAASLRVDVPVIGVDYARRHVGVRCADAGSMDRDEALRACSVVIAIDDGGASPEARPVAAPGRLRVIAGFTDASASSAGAKGYDGGLELLFLHVPDEPRLQEMVDALEDVLDRDRHASLHLCSDDDDPGIGPDLPTRHPERVRRTRLPPEGPATACERSHIVIVSEAFARHIPIACLDAMAMGNAVLLPARSPPVPGVIDGWNALAVAWSAAGLRRAVDRLLGDRALLERLAVNARTIVPAFGPTAWRNRLHVLLYEALPDSVPAPDPTVADVDPAGLEGRLEALTSELKHARQAQRFSEQQHYWSSNELAGIKASTGWALLQQLYRVRFALFPRGSQRETLARGVMRAARRLAPAKQGPAETASILPAQAGPAAGEATATVVAAAADPYAIVCLPIVEWTFRFQRPQQLATQFAAAGHEVFFAKHSFGDRLAVHRIAERITELELPGTTGLSPYRDRMSDADAERMAQSLIEHFDKQLPARLVCVVELPFWAPLASRLRVLTGCDVVYDCMDLHAGFSSNRPEALADEARLFADCDLVVVSSDALAEHAGRHAGHVAVVRNGVDYDHFEQVPQREGNCGERLTVGYYGAIADWFDSELVAELARRRPDWRIVLVGSTWSANTAPLERVSNIVLTGEKPYAELPALIAEWDCCVIPFLHTPLTAATNPVKVYEMLAAGKPVVSVGLPELAPMARDGLVSLAEGAAGFVEAIEHAVARDDAEKTARRRAFAAQNTWEARRRAFADAIDAIDPLVSIVVVTYNNRDLNELCLQSILHDTEGPPLEIIVVDNASTDGTPSLLRDLAQRDRRMRVVLNDDNRGFAAANNQGVALARGRYLCLLNNDTVVHGQWLRTLVGHLRRRARLGIVGPVTNAIGNEAKIPVGYTDLSGMPEWSRQYCAGHRGELDHIPMLAFFCVVLPRDVWRRVGPLDERFGTGMFEDDDYNRRVREAGFDVRLARDAFVHHWQRASFKLLGEDEYLRIYRRNEALYASKWNRGEVDVLAPLRAAAEAAPATIVFAPSVGWAIPLAQRPHHLARVMARDGYAVVFDCTNAADEVDTLREVEPRLFLYKGSPSALADLPRAVVWTFSYNHDYRDAFPPGVRVVYDWIDDLGVFPYDQRTLATLHARALREADVVISVARTLHEQALRVRPDALYVPNGVEEGRFECAPDLKASLSDPDFGRIVARGAPIAGYYGALARWFDYALLAETARRRPDWSFVLIGPDHDGSLAGSGVSRLANVHALGARDYTLLPGYLHEFDVATIPFAINDITLATSPLKLYEYFAAGKPVISTPMPECMQFDAVRIVADASEFADALDEARAAGRDSAVVAKLRALAQSNTWRARARTVLQALSTRNEAAPGRADRLDGISA